MLLRLRWRNPTCLRRPIQFVLTAAVLAVAVPASAQETTELPAIVVEGATLEAPPAKPKKKSPAVTGSQSETAAAVEPTASPGGDAQQTSTVEGVPLDEIGTAVTVVTNAELRAQQTRMAAEVLRSLPGVDVSQTGSPGGKTQVRIRGAEANHTVVYIDGIEANDVNDGDFDWSNVTTDNIEQIEVIRGAQSGLYGANAIGGVINIITKGGRGPITATGRIEGGSFNTQDVAARISGGTDKLWLSLSAEYRGATGFNVAPQGDENDPWHNSTVNFRGGVALTEGMTLDVVLRDTKKLVNFDEAPTTFPIVSLVAFDAPDVQNTHLFLGGVNWRWDLFDGAFTQIIRANRNETDNASVDTFGPSLNRGEMEKINYLATYRLGLFSTKHIFSGLVEKEEEHFTPSSDFVERSRERESYVAAYRGEYFDRVFTDASVRKDDNKPFVDFTTWHADVSLSLKEIALRPHASVGTGVALPGMFEQFGFVAATFVGNPNLKAEQSFSWDAGAEIEVVKNNTFVDSPTFTPISPTRSHSTAWAIPSSTCREQASAGASRSARTHT
jgi:vitamin B12 transporter